MPATGRVNITRQSIYAAIPILDIYSAYHIKKLRRYLVIVILVIVVPQTAIELALFDGMIQPDDVFVAIMDQRSELHAQGVYVVLWIAAGIALSIYLIRRWSEQWNYNAHTYE